MDERGWKKYPLLFIAFTRGGSLPLKGTHNGLLPLGVPFIGEQDHSGLQAASPREKVRAGELLRGSLPFLSLVSLSFQAPQSLLGRDEEHVCVRDDRLQEGEQAGFTAVSQTFRKMMEVRFFTRSGGFLLFLQWNNRLASKPLSLCVHMLAPLAKRLAYGQLRRGKMISRHVSACVLQSGSPMCVFHVKYAVICRSSEKRKINSPPAQRKWPRKKTQFLHLQVHQGGQPEKGVDHIHVATFLWPKRRN